EKKIEDVVKEIVSATTIPTEDHIASFHDLQNFTIGCLLFALQARTDRCTILVGIEYCARVTRARIEKMLGLESIDATSQVKSLRAEITQFLEFHLDYNEWMVVFPLIDKTIFYILFILRQFIEKMNAGHRVCVVVGQCPKKCLPHRQLLEQ